MASSPITSWQIDRETVETVADFIFWTPKSLQMVTAAMKLKDTCSFQEKLLSSNGTPLQYSCLENPMDRGAWWAAVHGVSKSRTRLSGFTFTFHFHALEKEMAMHSSVLAWRIPGTGEPSGLPSTQSRTRLKRLSSSSM